MAVMVMRCLGASCTMLHLGLPRSCGETPEMCSADPATGEWCMQKPPSGASAHQLKQLD